MANKQIHELPAAKALAPEDQVLVSQAGGQPHPARQPREPAGAACRPRAATPAPSPASSASQSRSRTSVPSATAWPTTAPRSRRRSTSHAAVHVPAGTYRLDGEIQVKPRRRLLGAGRDATVIDARAAARLHLPAQRGAVPVEPGASTDWNRSSLERHDRSRMTTGGVRVHGHEFRGTRPRLLRRRGAGRHRRPGRLVPRPGRRQRVHAVLHPGRLRRCRRPDARAPTASASARARPGVNYGDSMLAEISLKLGAPTPAACSLRGQPPGPDQQRADGARAGERAGGGRRRAVQSRVPSPAIWTLAGHGRRLPEDRPPLPAQHGRRRGRRCRASRKRAPALNTAPAPTPTSST